MTSWSNRNCWCNKLKLQTKSRRAFKKKTNCLNKELESNDPVINYKVYELQIKNRLIPKSNASLNETVNLFS